MWWRLSSIPQRSFIVQPISINLLAIITKPNLGCPIIQILINTSRPSVNFIHGLSKRVPMLQKSERPIRGPIKRSDPAIQSQLFYPCTTEHFYGRFITLGYDESA